MRSFRQIAADLVVPGLLALFLLCLAPAALAQSSLAAPANDEEESSEAEEAERPWFPVEHLNRGLPHPPDDLARETPMEAVESFLAATDTGRFDRAAHMLDLARIDAADQAARGPLLAKKLGELLHDDLWIHWGELPDRPDALIEEGTSSTPRLGETRRSLILGRLKLGDHEVPIRLRRVRPEGGDPVWVFAPQTVIRIDALYKAHGPGWIERKLSSEWQEESWLGLRRWELAALPILIMAAGISIAGLRSGLGWIASRLPWPTVTGALRGARTALALLIVLVPLQWAITRPIGFSAPVVSVLSPILMGAMVLAIIIALLRGLDRAIEHLARRLVGDPQSEYGQAQRQIYTTIYAVRRILLLVIMIIGIGALLTQLDVFSTFGISLLASAGVLTVIFGIAAQPLIGNLLASMQISFAKPIRIGDAVEYDGRWAYVEGIFYTHVRLRSWDERRLMVPVQYFLSRPFENYSIIDRKMTWAFTLTFDPSVDIQRVRDRYLEIAREDGDVIDHDILRMLAVDQDHEGVQLRFYCTASDAGTAWTLHCRLRENLLDWVRLNHPEWWPRRRLWLEGGGGVIEEGQGGGD